MIEKGREKKKTLATFFLSSHNSHNSIQAGVAGKKKFQLKCKQQG
jgi:hypothetical protein